MQDIPSRGGHWPSATSSQALDKSHSDAVQRLSYAIRCKTVAPDGGDYSEFDKLRRVFETNYPLVHASLEREAVDGYSLLYRWKGTDAAKAPIVLMGHMDVVPANESGWEYPPFEGSVMEGYVWGRGALDMKAQLVAVLEACEALLAEDFVPERDVYLSFGHNEESVSDTGAKEAARLLFERGVRPALVLDEGSPLMRGEEFGVRGDIVGIAVCEKGYADVAIRARSEGGHASVPGKSTALGRVCRAVERLERYPMRAHLNEPVGTMVKALNLPFPYGFFAEAGLFPGLVARFLGKTDIGRALTHTTMAPTMARGSSMPNVLPDIAEAVVNCRIAPWDKLDDVIAHMRAVIDDESVSVEAIKGNPPSPVANVNSPAYRLVENEARRLYPHAPSIPYMMLAATDSRYFSQICPCVLKFSPLRSLYEDHSRVHAANERVTIESFLEAIDFYKRLVTAAQQGLE